MMSAEGWFSFVIEAYLVNSNCEVCIVLKNVIFVSDTMYGSKVCESRDF